MTRSSTRNRVFFTRVFDDVAPADRYRFVAEQIAPAERCGPDPACAAQHHLHEHKGGLPSPLVFLAYVAARTSRIRLGTGILTLPLEGPIRVARAGSPPPDAPPFEACGMTSA